MDVSKVSNFDCSASSGTLVDFRYSQQHIRPLSPSTSAVNGVAAARCGLGVKMDDAQQPHLLAKLDHKGSPPTKSGGLRSLVHAQVLRLLEGYRDPVPEINEVSVEEGVDEAISNSEAATSVSSETEAERLAPEEPSEIPHTPTRVSSSFSSQLLLLSPAVDSPGSDVSRRFSKRCSSQCSILERSHSPLEDAIDSLDDIDDAEEALVDVESHIKRFASPERKMFAERPKRSPKISTIPTKTVRKPRPQSVIIPPNPVANKQINRRSVAIMQLPKNNISVQHIEVREVEEAEPGGRAPRPQQELQRRKSVAHLSSLLPPKPLTKSNKAPTVPSFELPGDAVARRLREQREARLSQQYSPEKPTAAVFPPRPKSTKPLTRPNFELPGESASRRKKEEREAKLKQEEEERKRRELKARLIRPSTSFACTQPRETTASRARQVRPAPEENTPKPREPALTKRASVMGLSRLRQPLTATTTTNVSPKLARGRESVISTRAPASRTTSASTGASSVSAGDFQAQKMRGKEIVDRENMYLEEKEHAKRAREQTAKQAREEAAERSRNQSRQWAERQKKKLAATRAASAMMTEAPKAKA